MDATRNRWGMVVGPLTVEAVKASSDGTRLRCYTRSSQVEIAGSPKGLKLRADGPTEVSALGGVDRPTVKRSPSGFRLGPLEIKLAFGDSKHGAVVWVVGRREVIEVACRPNGKGLYMVGPIPRTEHASKSEV